MADWVDCSEATTDSVVKVSEPKSRSATFKNSSREKFFRIRFDGCVQKNERAADWILEKQDVGRLVIELKGTDVSHAIEQVRATLYYLKQRKLLDAPAGGLVVCSQFPKVRTRVQLGMLSIKREFGSPLRVLVNARDLVFEDFLTFSS